MLNLNQCTGLRQREFSGLAFTATDLRDNLSLMVFLTSGAGHRMLKQPLSVLSLEEIDAVLGRTESMHSSLPCP